MPLGKFESECLTEIQLWPDSEHQYESTITFNPQLYTVASAWNDGVPLVETEMLKWLEPTDVDYVCFVIEYQKSHMAHLHMLIASPEKLPVTLCANVVKGLQRIAGRATFKPLINKGAYHQYISKDLEANFNKSQICHFKIYYR